MKTLAFCHVPWYNVYMENREMQTSNTEEMVTISVPSRFMRKFICRLRLSEVSWQ